MRQTGGFPRLGPLKKSFPTALKHMGTRVTRRSNVPMRFHGRHFYHPIPGLKCARDNIPPLFRSFPTISNPAFIPWFVARRPDDEMATVAISRAFFRFSHQSRFHGGFLSRGSEAEMRLSRF